MDGWKTFIQWKGTNVCMDWICPKCGGQFHVDVDFCYYLQCGKCLSVFRVGTEVTLTETEDTHIEPIRCEIEEDDADSR